MRSSSGYFGKSMISLLAGLGLATAMSFNSCSDVEFSDALSSNTKVPPGGLCLPGSQASGCIPPPPPRLVDYDDTFTVPASSSKVDILLVLDNSGSMRQDLTKLGERMDGLIAILDNGGVDWQMCHTLTDGSGATRDWALPQGVANRKLLLPSTVNKAQILFNTLDTLQDNGSGNEQGIVAIRNALSASANASCFRADAALSVVLISDEDEKSCGGRCLDWISSEIPTATQYREASSYRDQYRDLAAEDDPQGLVNFVKSTFNNKTFINHSIVIKPGDAACYDEQDQNNPGFFGVQYSRLQALTGGILGSICAASYADQLTAMGQRTRDAINSVTLRCAPVSAPTVTISPATAATWSVSGNKIIFSMPVLEGTQVRVRYTCAE
ncbi:MAG: hypothetical protein AB7N80_00180 [Bdellovibrionales bacterium]